MDKAGREFRRTKLKLRKIENYKKELKRDFLSSQLCVHWVLFFRVSCFTPKKCELIHMEEMP